MSDKPSDWDVIALDVARRFTQDTEPQRRANLQVAVIDAIKRARELDASGGAPRAAEAGDWLPIESAPRDGSYILVANSHGAWVAKWHPVYQSGYRPSNPWASMMLNHDHIEKPGRFDKPTHWRELKAPNAAMTGGLAGGGG